MINIWSVFDLFVFTCFKLIVVLRRLDDVFAFPASHCNSSTITASIYRETVAIFILLAIQVLSLSVYFLLKLISY